MFIIRYDIKEITSHTTPLPPSLPRTQRHTLEPSRSIYDKTDNLRCLSPRTRIQWELKFHGIPKLDLEERSRKLASVYDKIRLRPRCLIKSRWPRCYGELRKRGIPSEILQNCSHNPYLVDETIDGLLYERTFFNLASLFSETKSTA